MKELTLLEKKVIILLTYEISNISDTISKNILTDIINNITNLPIQESKTLKTFEK